MPALPQNSEPNGAAELQALASQVGMSQAMERLLAFRDEHSPASNPRYWAAVNFDLHSAEPRLHVFDRVGNDVETYLCAHGRGSDEDNTGYARIFSNEDGSNCTCVGVFSTGETYYGSHGYSLYLHGQEHTNFSALHRHIVMHPADYVAQAFADENGRVGRSLGCPAIGPEHSRQIIDALRGGSFLIHWTSLNR
jgi:L,D-transpeptidase catalytic domain